MIRRSSSLSLLTVLVFVRPAFGQAAAIRTPAPSPLYRAAAATLGDTLPPPPPPPHVGLLGDGSHDHRYRGFWTGTTLAGIVGLLWIAGCDDARHYTRWESVCSKHLGLKVPAMMLSSGMLGALIGSFIPKDEPKR